MEQVDLQRHPGARPFMYQRWRNLVFLHFPTHPSEVQRLIPAALEPDLFPDETGEPRAWVGLILFQIEGLRGRFLPPIPGTTAFDEINVRTYVRRNGDNPGVWFCSLDADNQIACLAARAAFALNYQYARMRTDLGGQEWRYESHRDGAHATVTAQIGGPMPAPRPGALEFFLAERYLLYACRGGRICDGRVFHHPYPLRSVETFAVDESLVQAAGFTPHPFVHAMASDGVDSEFFLARNRVTAALGLAHA